MRQPIEHTFLDHAGRQHSELLSASVPVGPSQIVDHSELVLLNHHGGGDVAIIRDGHMGDILMLTPTLRQLKQDLPNLRLHIFCDEPYVPLFTGNHYIESCAPIPNDINEVQGDIIANLNRFVERSPEAWITDRTSLFARAFGVTLRDGRPFCRAFGNTSFIPITVSTAMERYGVELRDMGGTVIIAPDASDPRRSLPDVTLERILTALDAHSVKYIVVGMDRGERVSILDSLLLLTLTRRLLCADNGMYHAAAAAWTWATPIRARVLFTTVPPELRTKWYGPEIIPIVSSVDCSPCEEKQVDGCTRQCTRAFDFEAIAADIEEELDR